MPIRRFTSILAVAVLSTACSREERTIGIGQSIHHDDFFYSVVNVERVERIGALQPQGQFCVVTFRVDNRAKRVDHEWDNGIAFVEDERGRRFENQTAAQQAAVALRHAPYRDRYVTHAGDAELALFVFDVPLDARDGYLKVRGSLLMGDVFDMNQYAHTRVRLF